MTTINAVILGTGGNKIVRNDAIAQLLTESGAQVVTLTHHVVWNCYEHEDHEENCYPETEWWQTDPQEVDLDEWEGVEE